MTVDVSATQRYYRSIDGDMLCDCGYCKNYRTQVKSEYPTVAEYLSVLGADIEKPFETSPLEPDENGFVTYCGCQYIVFGTCPADYVHRIGDVTFRAASSYPSTGITDEHFVLEFYPIRLKYLADLY